MQNSTSVGSREMLLLLLSDKVEESEEESIGGDDDDEEGEDIVEADGKETEFVGSLAEAGCAKMEVDNPSDTATATSVAAIAVVVEFLIGSTYLHAMKGRSFGERRSASCSCRSRISRCFEAASWTVTASEWKRCSLEKEERDCGCDSC